MNNERVELINAGFKTFNEAHSIDSGREPSRAQA